MTRNAARSIADLSGGTILATVDIAVPAERVFRALTSPEEIVHWWGSDDLYRTTSWTSDFCVGGKWRAEGAGADGKPFSVEGEFLEIDPPRRLGWGRVNGDRVSARVHANRDAGDGSP